MLFSAVELSVATADVSLAETAIAVLPVTVVLPLIPAIVFLATAFPEATADVFSAEAAIAVLPVTVVRLPVELLTAALTPPGSMANANPETAAMETANKILRIVIPLMLKHRKHPATTGYHEWLRHNKPFNTIITSKDFIRHYLAKILLTR
jgi:hypothetical protein